MKSFHNSSNKTKVKVAFEDVPPQDPSAETCWICSGPLDGGQKFMGDKVCNDCYTYEQKEAAEFRGDDETWHPLIEGLDPEEQTDGGAWNMHDASTEVLPDHVSSSTLNQLCVDAFNSSKDLRKALQQASTGRLKGSFDAFYDMFDACIIFENALYNTAKVIPHTASEDVSAQSLQQLCDKASMSSKSLRKYLHEISFSDTLDNIFGELSDMFDACIAFEKVVYVTSRSLSNASHDASTKKAFLDFEEEELASMNPAIRSNVEAVMTFASEHYEDGWGTIVECYMPSDIAKEVADCQTPQEAISKMANLVGLNVEQALNARWGEDSDSQINIMQKFKDSDPRIASTKQATNEFVFDPSSPDEFEARQTAYDWHSGQWSPLYEFASSGKTSNQVALINDIEHCISVYSADPSPSYYNEFDLDRLNNLLAVASDLKDEDIDGHQASRKDAASASTVEKALEILTNEILPAIIKNPYLKNFVPRIHTIQGRLAFALENLSEDELLSSIPTDKFVNTVLELRKAVRAGSLQISDMPTDPDKFINELDQEVSHLVTSAIVYKRSLYPTPERFVSSFGAKRAKISMKQEDFIEDAPKILGKPGQDPDSVNFFDDKELFRKFYSQFYEGAVFIADDGTLYQVLEILTTSGNFVTMLQDVLHPQIIFTISVNDLVAHIWKWISPFTVIVNPELAPDTASSISDIISVGDLEEPKVPEAWLSY